MTVQAETILSSVRPMGWSGVGMVTEMATIVRNRPAREVWKWCASLREMARGCGVSRSSHGTRGKLPVNASMGTKWPRRLPQKCPLQPQRDDGHSILNDFNSLMGLTAKQ